MGNIKRYWIITLSALILVLFCSLILFAQQKRVEGASFETEKRQSYDIKRVNFRDPKVSNDIPLLDEYFLCRAAAYDNINECDKSFSPTMINECRRNFNQYVGFWGRLMMEKQNNRKIVMACRNNETGQKFSQEECETIVKSISEGKLDSCEKYNTKNNVKGYNQCKAMLSGDINLCQRDAYCIDLTIYLKAIGNKDSKECGKIKNSILREVCRGYVSMNEEICSDNKKFIQFCQKHCK